MALETATHIADLSASNPTSGDPKSQGDDHIRLIKEVLQTTFPNLNRPVRFSATSALVSGNVTVDASADDGKIFAVSAEAAARTVTLPNSPAYDGYTVMVVKADHSLNLVTVSGGANTIDGASSFILHQRYQKAKFIWSSALTQWFADYNPVPFIGSVIAGVRGTEPNGYLFLCGKTLGNGSSGATGRANADCLGLYQMFWDTFANSICPVSSGRGASAAADFAANKTITMLDLRGRTIAGLDSMGGTAAVRLVGGLLDGVDGATLGASGGLYYHIQTLAELASHNHLHSIEISGSQAGGIVRNFGENRTSTDVTSGGPDQYVEDVSWSTTTLGINGGISLNGSSSPSNIVQPTTVLNYFIKY